MNTKPQYRLVSLPFGAGGPIAAPLNGPAALFAAGLASVFGMGNANQTIIVPRSDGSEDNFECDKIHRLSQFIRMADTLKTVLDAQLLDRDIPVFIGGDHAISLATSSYMIARARRCRAQAEFGLLWVDAHPDINTPETSPSGNLHGMVVASLLGLGDPRLAGLYGSPNKIKAEHLAFLGVRDIDPGEEILLTARGIKRASSAQLQSNQILNNCIEESLATVESAADGFILSFDVDVLDPSLAPGVSTPVPGGLSLEQLKVIFARVAHSPKLRAIEIVEYSPDCDKSGATAQNVIEACRSLVL